MDYEAILDEVLASDNWKGMGGLGADDMYGQLAMDVARLAVQREREACARIAFYQTTKTADETDLKDRIAAAIRNRQ